MGVPATGLYWGHRTANYAGKLTDASCCAGTASEGASRSSISDASGWRFRITKAGGRSWCFRFRDSSDGATGRSKIGNYPDISLKDAGNATTCGRVAEGVIPRHKKSRTVKLLATGQSRCLAKLYLAEIKDENSDRSKRSADQDEHALNRHVLPNGDTPLR